MTRDNGDGSFHLVIFPPNREPKSVDSVPHGFTDGQFYVRGETSPAA